MASTSSFLRTDRDANEITALALPDAEQTTLPLHKVFCADCFEALDFLRNEADELSESVITDNPVGTFHPVLEHLSVNTLEEYFRGRLSESEAKVVEAHIIGCGFCALRSHQTVLCCAFLKIVLA